MQCRKLLLETVLLPKGLWLRLRWTGALKMKISVKVTCPF